MAATPTHTSSPSAASESHIMIRVGLGNTMPLRVNSGVNLGSTNVSKKIVTATAITAITLG